jgi:hypothetical protein
MNNYMNVAVVFRLVQPQSGTLEALYEGFLIER